MILLNLNVHVGNKYIKYVVRNIYPFSNESDICMFTVLA